MKIGYARISTKDQSLDLQIDALKKAGCEEIFSDIASGAKTDRPQLNKAMERLRKGETLVVWKLDRLGRSLKHLIEIISELNERKISFQCTEDSFIDTTTPQGMLIFNIFAALSEFERNLIRERTKAGLKAARDRGRTGGRPTGLSKEAENTAIAAESLYRAGELSTTEISKQLGIAKSTLYRYLRHRRVDIGQYEKKV